MGVFLVVLMVELWARGAVRGSEMEDPPEGFAVLWWVGDGVKAIYFILHLIFYLAGCTFV